MSDLVSVCYIFRHPKQGAIKNKHKHTQHILVNCQWTGTVVAYSVGVMKMGCFGAANDVSSECRGPRSPRCQDPSFDGGFASRCLNNYGFSGAKTHFTSFSTLNLLRRSF